MVTTVLPGPRCVAKAACDSNIGAGGDAAQNTLFARKLTARFESLFIGDKANMVVDAFVEDSRNEPIADALLQVGAYFAA